MRHRHTEGNMRREDFMLQQVLCISALNKDLFSAILHEMIHQQKTQMNEPPLDGGKKKGGAKTPVTHRLLPSSPSNPYNSPTIYHPRALSP